MIHIRTVTRWRYKEDPDGNTVREFPPGRTYSLDDDAIGLLAIAEGAAVPLEELTDEQAERLALLTAAISGDETTVQALLDDATPKPDDAIEPPAAGKAKPAAKKARA